MESSRHGLAAEAVPGIPKKVVVLGDASVGKSSLISVLASGDFPESIKHVLTGSFCASVELEPKEAIEHAAAPAAAANSTGQSHSYHLSFHDTSGAEEDAKFRTLLYPQTDAFLLCFSVTRPASFQHIKTVWWPELEKQGYAGRKVLLVGCKVDLRTPETEAVLAATGEASITAAQADSLASELGAAGYAECSARLGGGGRRDTITKRRGDEEDEETEEERKAREEREQKRQAEEAAEREKEKEGLEVLLRRIAEVAALPSGTMGTGAISAEGAVDGGSHGAACCLVQ